MNTPPLDHFAWQIHVLHTLLVIASLCATAFPIAYARGGVWYKSTLGRVLMLHGVALALAVDLSLIFTYWKTAEFEIHLYIDMGVIALVAFATLALLVILVQTQYNRHISPQRERKQHHGTVRIEQKGDKKVFNLELEGSPEDLEDNEEIVFKVRSS